ncbi:TetR/AcrR family transcriptional regulator [Rhodococcus sp. OK302]|uniref:TetR/AcrR family transcriptional regulator n=1 Tax=Rhodococcus sp. OK302 TaxID=1882769 RepID=UPI000B93B31F|nr:TetR/AcrR family transcriptional regulator [Rhodococcus sp. OK302]OYD66956.1 TetR family transcriptional regulator [Rhodococcus sp. OK302]
MTPKEKRPKIEASEIEAAFARSFLANGFRGTSVDSVARELGVPKGSVFYHIGTKEEVFFRVQMEGMREFTHQLRQITNSGNPPEIQLREAIRDSVRRVDPSAGPLFAISRDSHHLQPEHAAELEAVRHDYQSLFIGIIESGIDAGIFRTQEHLKVVVFGILRFIGLVRDWYNPDGDLSLDELADVYWVFICGGLGHDALPA